MASLPAPKALYITPHNSHFHRHPRRSIYYHKNTQQDPQPSSSDGHQPIRSRSRQPPRSRRRSTDRLPNHRRRRSGQQPSRQVHRHNRLFLRPRSRNNARALQNRRTTLPYCSKPRQSTRALKDILPSLEDKQRVQLFQLDQTSLDSVRKCAAEITNAAK